MTTATMSGGRPVERGLLWTTVIALAVALVIVLAMLLYRRHYIAADAHRREQAVQAGPHLLVAAARPAPPTAVLNLQGEVRPFLQTTLYAKLPGFLREIHVDKGDRVKAGQVIGRIESPETDRQVLAARANAVNQRAIARRYVALAQKDFVSEQDAESADANARVAEEQLRQAQAMRGYEILRAPFDGVVVARYADPGAYLGATGASMPVVAVARKDRVRVFAYVDQRNAARVRVGDAAQVSFQGQGPGEAQPRRAQVARIAGALDPRTRMLLVEVQLPNEGDVVPGGFADVALTVAQPPGVALPVEALIVHGDRTLVGVVDGENRLRHRQVQVIDSDGKSARVDGVKPGERVALGVGESAAAGARVQPVLK